MPHEISTRRLLEQLTIETPGTVLTLGGLLQRFRTRAFGVFLLVSLLPAFLPLPVGMGAISGPLVCLIGAQLLLLFAYPWLPHALSRRELSAHRLSRFHERSQRWLERLEKLSRPRNEGLIDQPLARVFTGLQLLLLGMLLALPIPFTNYPFGLILLLYAIALIERDGRLMLIAWGLGLLELLLALLFSRQIAVWAGSLFG